MLKSIKAVLLGLTLLVAMSCSATQVVVEKPEVKVIIYCVEGLEAGSMWNRLSQAAVFTTIDGDLLQYQVCQPV